VDRDYMVRLKRGVRDKSESKAINEHMANAAWLTKALHQRSVTLIKVASEIVRQQQDFFDFGIHYLKPMTLKDVAAEALCHESTVSRITTQKYLACDRGVFEMKYFFTSTLQNGNGGSAYSSRSVMHLIKQMVDAEKASAVLSDDEIAERLNKQGIDVARRTVVKYRQQMDIPSSVQRRRSKQGRHVF
jgi:RNA polymerase sigma-54 factor